MPEGAFTLLQGIRQGANMRAALLTEINQPLELMSVKPFEALQYGQVLMRVISSGICGAQLQEIRGEKGTHFPRLIGHEGVGIVEEIGCGVRKVLVGQKCVMHWRKGEGIECESPSYIIGNGGYIPDLITGGQVVTFATHSVCSESRLTPIPDDVPDELCCLLGCSLSTALGTIENEANLKIGESVLIIGCGGLGLNLILAAKMRQAGSIVVVEKCAEKKEIALRTGATAFHSEWSQYVMEDDFDVVIDTTGVPKAISSGIQHLAPSGRLVMVGQPKPGEFVNIPFARNLFRGDGCCIMATQGGRFSPTRDIPKYIAAWRAGRLNIDGIVTHRFPLSEINAALDCVRNGQAGRVLVDCTE